MEVLDFVFPVYKVHRAMNKEGNATDRQAWFSYWPPFNWTGTNDTRQVRESVYDERY